MGEAAADPAPRGAVSGVSNAPIALLALDGDGHVREASPAACRLLGLDRKDILGHELSELLTPRRDVVALSAQGDDAPATGLNGHAPSRRPSARERQILGRLRNAKQKLGARTRAQAVAIALRGGLVSAG
jgi:PAS domain-containing protein